MGILSAGPNPALHLTPPADSGRTAHPVMAVPVSCSFGTRGTPMGEGIRDVVAAIDALATVDGTDELTRLQEYADRYFADPQAAHYLGVWFRLYERFPEADGYGIFWSILHGIEAQAGYEPQLVESVRRRASRFPVLMVNRLLNGGVRSVGSVQLVALLAAVAADEQSLPSAREDAQGFLDHQRKQAAPGAAPDPAS